MTSDVSPSGNINYKNDSHNIIKIMPGIMVFRCRMLHSAPQHSLDLPAGPRSKIGREEWRELKAGRSSHVDVCYCART